MAPNIRIFIQWYDLDYIKESFTHDVGGFAEKFRL